MLTFSNRQRMIQAMDEALQLIESWADYYNLKRDDEVAGILARLQVIRAEMQQRNGEALAQLKACNPSKTSEGNGV